MFRLKWCWGVVLLGLSACATPIEPTIPRAAQLAYQAGLRLEAADKTAEAQQSYERATKLAAEFPDAQLALMRIIRKQSGEQAARRYAQNVADSPATAPEGKLLLGLLSDQLEARIALLAQAIAERPSLHQAIFELGMAYQRQQRFALAASQFEEVIARKPRLIEAYEQASYCQFRLFHWPLALYYANQALKIDSRAIKPRVFLSVDRLIHRDFIGAIRHFRNLRKYHPTYTFSREEQNAFLLSFRGELSKLRIAQKVDAGLELAREAAREFPGSGMAHDMLGYFTELSGDHATAAGHYTRALQLDPYRLETVQDARRAMIRQARYADAFKTWRRIVPIRQVMRADNEVGPRYRRLVSLLQGCNASSPAEQLAQLADALATVGWLDESLVVYQQASRRTNERALKEQLASDRTRIANIRAFLRALLLKVRAHYGRLERAHAGMDIDDFRDWIASEWPERRPPDLNLDLKRWFVLVREADPFCVKEGSLAQALERYNLVFDAGNNYGYLDIRVMKLLYRKRIRHQVGQLPYPHTVLMTDETILDNYLGYLSGHPRISGRAFLSRQGFYVSIDTIRPGKHVLQAFLRSPPASKKQAEGASSYSHRFDAALRKRFLARFGIDYPNQKPDGTLLDRTFQAFLHGHLHNVWLHELGHLVDFERYVPLSENLSTNIWVALRCGLSPARIELRFEQMAETFSLATTRFPYLSIQDNLNRLSLNPDSLFYMILVAWQKKDPKDSPYYTGAKRIIAGLMKQAGLTDPVELAGLSGARIRKLARSVCREEGFPFR